MGGCAYNSRYKQKDRTPKKPLAVWIFLYCVRLTVRGMACFCLALAIVSPSAWAQQTSAPLKPARLRSPPVMKNVFFNVAWGSATGALLGAAAVVVAADNPSSPENTRSEAVTGATYGGLVGLGVGLYLVFSGITFNLADATQSPAVFVNDGPQATGSEHLHIGKLRHAEPNTPFLAMGLIQTPHGNALSINAKVFAMRF